MLRYISSCFETRTDETCPRVNKTSGMKLFCITCKRVKKVQSSSIKEINIKQNRSTTSPKSHSLGLDGTVFSLSALVFSDSYDIFLKRKSFDTLEGYLFLYSGEIFTDNSSVDLEISANEVIVFQP